MREIFVLAERRRGELRDITLEMLTKGRELAQKTDSELTAVVLGENVEGHSKILAEYAKRVLAIKDKKLEHFNSDIYQKVLSYLIKERKPLLTLIGHTSYGIELAPSLAVSLNIPLATDCIDVEFENETFTVTRQIYGGKVNVKASLQKAWSYIITVRQAAFQAEKTQLTGEIDEIPSPLSEEMNEKRFVDYVLPPPGGVDITAADIVCAIGRGIKDQNNILIGEELAEALGGVLACSRPIVDKGWLQSNRQVGSSGKTVKPKLYIAVGISGAFQHIVGMKNSDLIIAINKDPNAPIFKAADYGVVDDLFKIVPALTQKIKELKSAKA
jgi:electron transfer flavoprotein alpha subunit